MVVHTTTNSRQFWAKQSDVIIFNGQDKWHKGSYQIKKMLVWKFGEIRGNDPKKIWVELHGLYSTALIFLIPPID